MTLTNKRNNKATAKKDEKAFGFLDIAHRPEKPRKAGMTEVRWRGGGTRALEDLVEAAGEYIDILKFAGGVQRLLDRSLVKEQIAFLKEHQIEASTGGLLERVILQGPRAVYQFLDEAKDLGFVDIEVSSGLLILSLTDKLDIIRLVTEYGLMCKPEVAGAYGIVPGQEVKVNADLLIREADACLEAGAYMIMIESEGITQNVPVWDEEVVYKLLSHFESKQLLFEAADPDVYTWYVKLLGPEANLFVDSTQVLGMEATRTGVWGHSNTWGRIGSFQRK